MSRYFSFRFKESISSTRESLVVFVDSNFEVSLLTKTVKDDVDTNLIPNNLFVMGYDISADDKTSLMSDMLFINEIESWIGEVSKKVKLLSVDTEGQITDVVTKINIPFQDSLMTAGAIKVFKNRKGLITSLPSYHFAKPSGDHCDKFIRASNLFTSGVEVSFLAIGLLPYLKSNIKRIYVDTSSISFLVSIAIQLSGKFERQPPIIESFESYSVFKQSYDFNEGQNSIVVVSATTSGGLTNQLIRDTTFSFKDILTLFYSSIPKDQIGIFDISKAVGTTIYSVPQKHCKLCQQGSKVIKIEGEQFLPETPKHELLTIRKVDFNKKRQVFFKEFATKSLLKFNGSSEKGDKEHFYIDIKMLLKLEETQFEDVLKKKLNKHFSRDIGTIIWLDDTDAEALSSKIYEIIADESVKLVAANEITEKELINHNSVMVVASAITSGRKLLSMARKLRGIGRLATITYLVGFSKLPTKSSFDQLKKDLCLGGHELVTLKDCYLPRYSERTKIPWDIEKDKLAEFGDEPDVFNDEGIQLPRHLASRLGLLNNVLADDDLFLTSATGKTLKLRNTFAFWTDLDLDTDNSTQSDVYWTIQAILHDLRLKNEQGLATTYHSTLISPICFDRFNDGVIQSCLLRAAKPIELNYAVEEIFSRQITDIILSVIRNCENPQGEACLEFLMAIWTERLKVVDIHLEEIVEVGENETSKNVLFLINQIKKTLKIEIGASRSNGGD